MKEKELAQEIIDQAKAWADEQYAIKGGHPGTDLYFKNKHRAMTELINHIEQTYIEQRENA
jgi:hypothetical protein